MEGKLSAKSRREDHAVIVRNGIFRPGRLVTVLAAAKKEFFDIGGRALFQNAVEEKLTGRAATPGFAMRNLHGIETVTVEDAESACGHFTVHVKRVKAEISTLRSLLGNLIIKSLGCRITIDSRTFVALPSGGFQFIKLFHHGGLRMIKAQKFRLASGGFFQKPGKTAQLMTKMTIGSTQPGEFAISVTGHIKDRTVLNQKSQRAVAIVLSKLKKIRATRTFSKHGKPDDVPV